MYDCTDWKLNVKVESPLYFMKSWERLQGQLLGYCHLKLNKKKCLEEYGSGFQIITCGIPSLHYKVGYLI